MEDEEMQDDEEEHEEDIMDGEEGLGRDTGNHHH